MKRQRQSFHRRPDRDQTRRPAAPTSWDHVAGWYDKLVGESGSDYHRNVVLPAVLRMLGEVAGKKVLDVCCGQGVLCRMLAQQGAQAVGIDASPRLIDAARRHGGGARYETADARDLGQLADASFDAATCVMALQDLDDPAAVIASMAKALRPGGKALIVIMHPCFRVPRQSSWGWDETKSLQYRRIDAYAAAREIPIATHPGAGGGEQTTFYHRPLADYINAFGACGMGVVACEELLTHRQSQPGGRSRAENRAKREFPLFLAMSAVKAG